jgi:hypothetical protein
VCRPWPGFHCSNHPSDKLREIARKLHVAEQKKEDVSQEQENYRKENPDTWKGSDIDGFYSEEQAKLQKSIDTLEEAKEDSLTEFYATAKGKESLEAKINDEKLSDAERFNSASELAAAEDRRIAQRKLAKILQDPLMNDKMKLLHAKIDMNRSKKLLTSLTERGDEIEANIEDNQEAMYVAKANGDDAEVKHLKEQRIIMVRELAYIDKQRKQLHAHIENTSQWMKRFSKKMQDDIFNGLDKAIDFSVDKFFDHMR